MKVTITFEAEAGETWDDVKDLASHGRLIGLERTWLGLGEAERPYAVLEGSASAVVLTQIFYVLDPPKRP